MSQVLELYRSTNNKEFTKLITQAAPYFSTIDPMFEELKPGYAEITVPNTKSIHNHRAQCTLVRCAMQPN